MDEIDEDFEAALSLRDRYEGLWDVLHSDVRMRRDQRYRVDRRLNAINELGYVVDEVILEPGDEGSDELHLRVAVAGRDYHSRRLRQLTGIEAGEGQSAILLNDLDGLGGHGLGWPLGFQGAQQRSRPDAVPTGRAGCSTSSSRPWRAAASTAAGRAHRPGAGLLRPPRGALAALRAGRPRRRQRGRAGVDRRRQAPSGSSAQMAAAEITAEPRRLGWQRP